jgi:ABC-2 type transport system ATP-binding protein
VTPARVWAVRDATVVLGSRAALRNVTLTVPEGQVTAVVGGDGAGKTTLLRCLTGRVRPTAGRVEIPPLREIGFMPAAGGVWQDLTVEENIAFVAAAYRIRGTDLARRREHLLTAAGLTQAAGRPAANLSGGMRQKLAFCLAMLHRPALLVLDEPSTGVDPVSRIDLWRLIARTAADGTAVVHSTTYLDEAERAAHVVVLDHGNVLAADTPAQVTGAVPGTIAVCPDPRDRGRAWRRGRLFHTWHPGPAHAGEVPVRADLEDAVIALALAGREAEEGPR